MRSNYSTITTPIQTLLTSECRILFLSMIRSFHYCADYSKCVSLSVAFFQRGSNSPTYSDSAGKCGCRRITHRQIQGVTASSYEGMVPVIKEILCPIEANSRIKVHYECNKLCQWLTLKGRLQFTYVCDLSLQDGSTLMHIAAEAGRPEAALVFMKKGVPLHMSNKVNA